MDRAEIDFAGHMEAVARRLGGKVNPRLSTKEQLRFGSNGSLSVEIAGAEAGTWYDHEEKIGGGVLALIGHKLGVDGPAAVDWLQSEYGTAEDASRQERPPTNGHAGPARRLAATYDYTDEEGELLFQAVRYEPKDFRQRQPDGAGGWTWNLKGVRIVPYRLPSLVAAVEHGRTVYVVEGEKDVEALGKFGFAATCNPMGAGKWRPDFGQYFHGADVVVIPDNDDAGLGHADQVAGSLTAAKRIRRLELPGLPPKGDVADWLAQGGTSEELMRLTDTCSPIALAAASAGGLGEWDAGEISAAPPPPRGWLVGTTFCRRYISSAIAAGGVGKTTVRLLQALAAATGRPLTGEHVFQRCRVLIVSLEDDADELRRRLRAAMIHHNVTAEDLRGWLFLAAPGNTAGKLAEKGDGEVRAGKLVGILIETIKRLRIDLVILDPFVKSHAIEENANSEIDDVVSILARIAIENDCAVDVPHHQAKGSTEAGNADRGRGASAFKDGARLVVTVGPMSPDEAKGFGLGEAERRSLVRVDNAKVNLAPNAGEATWFKLIGVPIGNGTDLYPAGDNVQTVERWIPPDAWEGLSSVLLNDILTAIDAGMSNGNRYSDQPAAKDRAAWKVVVEFAPDKTEQQARQIIKTWVKNELLTMEEYTDPTRGEKTKGLVVNHSKRPS